MALNSKVDNIYGLLSMDGLLSKSTILQKSVEIINSEYNAMVKYNLGVTVLAIGQNNSKAFYSDSKLVSTDVNSIVNPDITVITETTDDFPQNLSELKIINVLVKDKSVY